MKKSFSNALFQRMPLVGIVRGVKRSAMEHILPMYQEEGFTTLEVTMNTAGAEDMIREAAEIYEGRLNIGAGSVRSVEELQKALDAGAQFIVTPIVDQEVCETCNEVGMPFFPGAYTPTEVYQAWKYGATAVKVFPTVTGGLKHVKAIQAPLEMVPLLPTGGVGADNLAEYFDAGVYGVGLGSSLFPGKVIEEKDWDGLRKCFRHMATTYHQWKEMAERT